MENPNNALLIWCISSFSDVKDLASKLVNDIEECDKKIIYLKNVQRRLRVSTSFVFTLLYGNSTHGIEWLNNQHTLNRKTVQC